VSIAAVVLAAGAATRFGRPKQRELLPSVLERVAASPVDEIVIVEGAYELELPSNKLLQGTPARLVRCADWELGPGASLRCGLAALGREVEAAVVVLADGPNLSPLAIERVLGEWRTHGGVVAATYAGARGHPLVLPREHWDDVPDAGLHALPARYVPSDDLGAPGDIDEPADWGQASV
jgi:CTP:molybdopterin cytidylyltransferase MocA